MVNLRRRERLLAGLACGFVVAVSADMVFSAITGDEMAVGATVLLTAVTTLAVAWALR